MSLEVNVDPAGPVGSEAYECHLLDASALKGVAVHALRWRPPSGVVLIHHAMMFATAATGTPGLVPCEPVPAPVIALPLYAPGGETTTLADGVSIVVPMNAERLYLELHLVRTGIGSASASVEFLESVSPPEHLAGWVDDYAPVPDIAPFSTATATARCGFGAAVHVVGAWPHMHRLGSHFSSTIVRANGDREALLDVPTWQFQHQPLYPLEAALGEGDAIETACSWHNTTDATVKAGSFSTDEMCNQGLVVWPITSATCVR